MEEHEPEVMSPYSRHITVTHNQEGKMSSSKHKLDATMRLSLFVCAGVAEEALQ